MFKKRIAWLVAVVVIASVILIPPVRAAAESALSIFRVADAKTIRISVNDLQNMMTFVEKEKAQIEQGDDAQENSDELFQLLGKAQSDIKPISGVQDFTAFRISLPTALKNQTPELYAAGSQSQIITLDTAKINATLSGLGATVLVDSSLNGTNITVSSPPAVAAVYSDVRLSATQNVYIDAPDDVMHSLWTSVLSIPAMSEELRAQLAAIDPKTRDVYLPVIEGLGREADLSGTTGYIYTSGDLVQVLSFIPGLFGDTGLSQLQDQNASVLVWTKDGVLYCLDGQISDSALSQIARSIR